MHSGKVQAYGAFRSISRLYRLYCTNDYGRPNTHSTDDWIKSILPYALLAMSLIPSSSALHSRFKTHPPTGSTAKATVQVPPLHRPPQCTYLHIAPSTSERKLMMRNDHEHCVWDALADSILGGVAITGHPGQGRRATTSLHASHWLRN